MGQKGSNASQEQINEYYQRRHSFAEKPNDLNSNYTSKSSKKSSHKRSISKDLNSNKQVGRVRHNQNNHERKVIVFYYNHGFDC